MLRELSRLMENWVYADIRLDEYSFGLINGQSYTIVDFDELKDLKGIRSVD